MIEKPCSSWPSAALPSGGGCSISEAEWFHFLESCEPLHQWGGVFLLDEGGAGGSVRVYLRDDSGRREHRCLRLDSEASGRARASVEEIEGLARGVADLLADHRARPALSPSDLAAEQSASERFTSRANAVYAALSAIVTGGA